MNRKKNLLLFDNDPKSRARLKSILSAYHCIESDDVDTAIEESETNQPHLLVVDLTSPLRSGFAFLERKVKKSQIAKIPVIVVVQAEDEVRHYRGTALGAVDYFVKPLDPNNVKKTVSRVLKEPHFKRFFFREENRPKVDLIADARVTLLSETSFVVEAPVRLASNTPISVTCPVFWEFGIDDHVMKTAKKSPYQIRTGLFAHEVSLVGVDEATAKSIRKRTQYWKSKSWTL